MRNSENNYISRPSLTSGLTLHRNKLKALCHFLIALLLFGLAPRLSAETFLFLCAAEDADLVSYRVDSKSGELSEFDRLQLQGFGGTMTLTRDGKMLYVMTMVEVEGEKRRQSHVTSIAINAGRFEHRKTARVPFRSPAMQVDATGKNLLASDYGGRVGIWKIDDQRNCTGEALEEITTELNAHSIATDPSNRFVYVPHTKANAIYQYAFDPATGELTPLDPPTAPGPDKDHHYHEPRHYAHHPSLPMAFTANERGGGISSWNFDANTGALTLRETLSSLAPEWEEKNRFAGADIHITPNGRFVYVSNRDGRKLEEGEARGDSLAGFEIDPKTGKLKPIGRFLTGRSPRSFCIDSTGHFAFVACQLSDQLEVFRIDQETGELRRIGSYETGRNPIWVTPSQGH